MARALKLKEVRSFQIGPSKRTFEECGVLYRFGRKDGEYSQQVVCVVNWNSVQHNQVLVGTSPSHIHACKTFHTGLHTRHQLNGLQQVGFSQYGRGMPDLCHRYLMRSHGCAFYAGLPLVRDPLMVNLRLTGFCGTGRLWSRMCFPDISNVMGSFSKARCNISLMFFCFISSVMRCVSFTSSP